MKLNKHGWTLNGTIWDEVTEETPKAGSKAPLTNESMSKEDLIIEALKTTVFKRGKTYKEIGEKYNVKPQQVFKIRKANKL